MLISELKVITEAECPSKHRPGCWSGLRPESAIFAGAGAGTGVGILNKNRIRSRSGFFSFYRSQIIAFNKFKFSLIIKIPND